jgi:hypothetical protein
LDAYIGNLGVSDQNLQTTDELAVVSPIAQSLPGAVEALERRMIEEAGKRRKQKAAQVSGLSRQRLIKKLIEPLCY